MNGPEIRAVVHKALASVAPETESVPIDAAAPLRDQLDLDSMDFLNFMVALHKAFGVEIAEKDYPSLATIDGCVRFVESAWEAAGSAVK